jgi:hypothetical protein
MDNIIKSMNDYVEKLKSLLKNRDHLMPSNTMAAAIGGGSAEIKEAPVMKDENEDGVAKYTRGELDQLIMKQQRSFKTNANNAGGGYFDNLFLMFQIYVAFIHALTNTANVSASMIFGNLTLQDAFSKFLVNVLNSVLNINVTDLTPEQLRDLLEKNRPVIQQISAIIIDEASQLLVGLSDVFSKIAMDWIQNVLPGLVESAAIGIPSAVEAAIPPLGEVVDIVNTALALMGSFMKVVGGIQRNSDKIYQGVGLVEDAYKSLQNIQNLLTNPSAATSAVLNSKLNNAAAESMAKIIPGAVTSAVLNPNAAAQKVVSRATQPAFPVRRQVGGKKMKSRRYLKDPKKFKTYISKIRNKTAKKEVELISSIRELKNM